MDESEVIIGWYLKRIPLAGPVEYFLSLNDKEVILGRLVCSSPHISRKHVLFQKTFDDKVFIKDLGGVNGTFVNGSKIESFCLHPLNCGDRITLGREVVKEQTDFEFELCFARERIILQVIKNYKRKEPKWLTLMTLKDHNELPAVPEDKIPSKPETIEEGINRLPENVPVTSVLRRQTKQGNSKKSVSKALGTSLAEAECHEPRGIFYDKNEDKASSSPKGKATPSVQTKACSANGKKNALANTTTVKHGHVVEDDRPTTTSSEEGASTSTKGKTTTKQCSPVKKKKIKTLKSGCLSEDDSSTCASSEEEASTSTKRKLTRQWYSGVRKKGKTLKSGYISEDDCNSSSEKEVSFTKGKMTTKQCSDSGKRKSNSLKSDHVSEDDSSSSSEEEMSSTKGKTIKKRCSGVNKQSVRNSSDSTCTPKLEKFSEDASSDLEILFDKEITTHSEMKSFSKLINGRDVNSTNSCSRGRKENVGEVKQSRNKFIRNNSYGKNQKSSLRVDTSFLIKPCSVVLERCNPLVAKYEAKRTRKMENRKGKKWNTLSLSSSNSSDGSESSEDPPKIVRRYVPRRKKKNCFILSSDDKSTFELTQNIKKKPRRRIVSSDESDSGNLPSPILMDSDFFMSTDGCNNSREEVEDTTLKNDSLRSSGNCSVLPEAISASCVIKIEVEDTKCDPVQRTYQNENVHTNVKKDQNADKNEDHQESDDDCFVYSQIDEVITISSDDDDGFPPSSCGEELVRIKEEPQSDEEQWCEEQVDSTDFNSALDTLVSEDELKKRLKWSNDASTPEEDCSDFFPQLSQSFNDIEEDLVCEPKSDGKVQTEADKTELEKIIAKNRQRKISTTSYTDALPQTNKKRGRSVPEETAQTHRFYGKHQPSLDEWASKKKHQQAVVQTTCSKSTKKKDLKQTIKAKFSHRIPMPGGGSAIRSRSIDNGARILQTSECSNRKQPRTFASESKSSRTVDKIVPSIHKKAPKPAEQRFASRQSGLIEELAKESSNKRSSQYKIPRKTNALVPFGNKFNLDGKFPMVPLAEQERKTNDSKNNKIEETTTSVDKSLNVTATVPKRNSNTKVRFSDDTTVMLIPNVLAEKKAPKEKNVRDPRVFKQNTVAKNHQLPNTPHVQPGPKFPNANVIHHIINWKTAWLKEQSHDLRKPPPVVNNKLLKMVPISFNSLDEYCNTYYSLLLLEIWQSIYKDWCTLGVNKPYVRVCINEYSSLDDCWQFHCQGIIHHAKPEQEILMEGHLITMHLKILGEEKAYHHVFGFVVEHKSEPLETCGKIPELLSSFVVKNGRIVTLIIRTSKRPFAVDLSVLVKAELVSYIKPMLRQADAIVTINSSLLLRDILLPRKNIFAVSHQHDAMLQAFGHFNRLQNDAILGAADAVLKHYATPQIKLFQGPPGTGKTNMITGLIQHLIHPCTCTKQRLLVVAASNGAIDEIARRLMKIRPQLKQHESEWNLRLVRIGQQSQISSDVKPIMIEELVYNNLVSSSKDAIKLEIRRLEETISLLDKNIIHGKSHGISLEETRALHEKMASACRRHRNLMNQQSKEHAKVFSPQSNLYKKTLKEILEKANVVLSTLNSCRQTVLETTFGKKGTTMFTCCIVDEATQCTEPELLTALQYSMSKLILVGDPKQLPATVLSSKAAQFKYYMSFFERVYHFFRVKLGESPVFMLTEQYRMHPEICWFPSNHFYSRQLQTARSINEDFPLKPYMCINMPEGKENSTNGANICNPYEAHSVVNLCKLLLPVLPQNTSIGIITPYQAQKQVFAQLIKSSPDINKSSCSVEVNTIDGFQGREKDVIILSCVRSSRTIGFLTSSQRLNVAITRARECLLICGHLEFLCAYAHWEELVNDAKTRNVFVSMTMQESVGNIIDRLKKDHSSR